MATIVTSSIPARTMSSLSRSAQLKATRPKTGLISERSLLCQCDDYSGQFARQLSGRASQNRRSDRQQTERCTDPPTDACSVAARSNATFRTLSALGSLFAGVLEKWGCGELSFRRPQAELFVAEYPSADAAKQAYTLYTAYLSKPSTAAVGAKAEMPKGLGDNAIAVRTKFGARSLPRSRANISWVCVRPKIP